MRPVLDRPHPLLQPDRRQRAPPRGVQGAARGRAVAAAAPAPRKRLISDADLATIWVTNPTRRLFGRSGPTKLDVAVYYAARRRLHAAAHPRPAGVSLVRCPTGRPQDCFFQRHAFTGMPPTIATLRDRRSPTARTGPTSPSRTPRATSRSPSSASSSSTPGAAAREPLEKPDRIVFDLDPGEGIAWREVVEAAVHVRGELEALGLVALRQDHRRQGRARRRADHPEARLEGGARGHRRARRARSPRPRPTPSPPSWARTNRKRRIFIDFHRNARSATAVAPYSLRARTQPAGIRAAYLGGSRVHRRAGGFELFFAPGPGRRLRRPLGGDRRVRPGPAGPPARQELNAA